MVDTSAILMLIWDWAKNPLIWILAIILTIAFGIGGLWLRQRKKLVYPCAEIVDLGGSDDNSISKTSINFLGAKSAGWYGKKLRFFKLWDEGEKVMRTKDGEIIEEFSEMDFQEVNGQRGIIFYRDPNRRLLFPISKMKVSNKQVILDIAPATFTDTAVEIINAATEETKDQWQQIYQIAMWAAVILFSFLAILMVTRMISDAQDKADKTVLEAGKTCMENAKVVCESIVHEWAQVSKTVPGSTAP